MLRVSDLRALSSFPLRALVAEVGPYVLVQKPPAPLMAQMATQMAAVRTVVMSSRTRMTENLMQMALAFEHLVVLTPAANANAPSLVLGRAPTCGLVIHEPSVSGRHAELSFIPATKTARLKDLGSTNGTFVNARAIERQEAELHDGDTVCLGDAAFLFILAETLHSALAQPPAA